MNLSTCRAAVLKEFRAPLEVWDLPMPEKPAPGHILVRVIMAGVCGTDVHLRNGELPLQLPVVLGHETVGEIVALGEGVEADWIGAPLPVGSRVTWHSSRSCGECYYCRDRRLPTRCLSRRAYGISYPADRSPHLAGGFAEYIYLLPGTAIFRLPDDLTTQQVVGSGCALVTAIHGIERAGVEWGDRVVIQGSGPVGIAALAIALSSGAAAVCVVGAPPHRLEVARRFGAAETIDVASTNPEERRQRILEWSGGHGADLVIECVGRPAAVQEGWLFCRDGGRYLTLGHYADTGTAPLNPHLITRKELTIYGSWSSEPRHLAAGLEFLQRTATQFPFHELVSDTFSLEQANEALRAMETWTARKSAVIP